MSLFGHSLVGVVGFVGSVGLLGTVGVVGLVGVDGLDGSAGFGLQLQVLHPLAFFLYPRFPHDLLHFLNGHLGGLLGSSGVEGLLGVVGVVGVVGSVGFVGVVGFVGGNSGLVSLSHVANFFIVDNTSSSTITRLLQRFGIAIRNRLAIRKIRAFK